MNSNRAPNVSRNSKVSGEPDRKKRPSTNRGIFENQSIRSEPSLLIVDTGTEVRSKMHEDRVDIKMRYAKKIKNVDEDQANLYTTSKFEENESGLANKNSEM